MESGRLFLYRCQLQLNTLQPRPNPHEGDLERVVDAEQKTFEMVEMFLDTTEDGFMPSLPAFPMVSPTISWCSTLSGLGDPGPGLAS